MKVILVLRSLNPPKSPAFSRARFKLALALSTLVVLSTIATWWMERQLSGPIVEWARLRAINMATAMIHDAVRGSLAGGLSKIEIFTVARLGEDGIPIVRYNMGAVNEVTSDAVHAILDAFGSRAPQEFQVPVGELTGMRVFAGWGPMVPIRIFATGSVVAEPKVDFVAAGINQVAHRLYLDVEVTMAVLAPFLNDRIVVRHKVPIADDVLPGPVPETYVNLTGFSGSLAEAALALESVSAGAIGSR